MRVEELLELKKKVFERACELTVKKGRDYSGTEDTLLNLKASRILGVRPERAVLVRLVDKIMRMNNLLESGKSSVEDESIFDTVVDAHNYLDLFLALLEEDEAR